MGAGSALTTVLDWLQLAEHELLLFAAFWFIVSAIDEAFVDLGWLYLRLVGKARAALVPAGAESRRLSGAAAVLVPAWHEADVIDAMIRHTLKSWRSQDFRLYIGCYRNDAATLAAGMAGAARDPRVRLVVHDADGPTTKADCLNRLYHALGMDEARSGRDYASIVLHDAEDMVHPAALAVIDRTLREVDFVQLPVRPEPQANSPWVAGHYSDEFAESHAKSLVFRDAIGAAIPAAGVGCGFSRETFRKLAQVRMEQGERGPFAAECLTEDYELGLIVSHLGGHGRFVRMVDQAGGLVATRSYFPADLEAAVRQKTRWIHGIALQSWDRMGWTGRLVDIWMAARDRRGPLAAFVLAAAYVLVPIELLLGLARSNDMLEPLAITSLERGMMAVCLFSVMWRMVFRFAFTAREYGMIEGVRGVLRMPVGNVIAILAARRAIMAYVRSLAGGEIVWDKTSHTIHPANAQPRGNAA